MNDGFRRWVPYITIGFVAYILFLIATAPAVWVGELLNRVSTGKARLLAAKGTIWNGSGTVVINSAGGSSVQQNLKWRIEPIWLITGRLQADVESDGDISLRGEVAIGYHQLRFARLSGEFSASHAQAFYPPAIIVSPTGKLQFRADDMVIGRTGFEGELQVIWKEAGSKLGSATNLGDYQLTAKGQNGAAALRIETLRGDLTLTAKGNWQVVPDGQLALDGELVAGDRESTLGPVLAAMNLRKEGNRYPIRMAQRLLLPPILGGSS